MGKIYTLKYLPEFFHDIIDFAELCKTYDVEFLLLEKEIEKLLNNFFFDFLGEEGCKRWEDILKISMRETDTLEDRRFRIKSIYFGDTPYTKKTMLERLEMLVGKGNVTVSIDVKNYKVTVRVSLSRKNQLAEIIKMIEKMVPLNMIIDVKLLYNTYETLGLYTHDYLGRFTHYALKENVLGG